MSSVSASQALSLPEFLGSQLGNKVKKIEIGKQKPVREEVRFPTCEYSKCSFNDI